MQELEIFTYDGSGYNPTMHFDSWRVAFLNYAEHFDTINKLERHMLTDEVFVLLNGQAVLLIGEKGQAVHMESGKIYNVKKVCGKKVKAQIKNKKGCLIKCIN